MIVRKPARRQNSRNQLPGTGARRQANGEPGNPRLNNDSNRVAPARDPTPNTETNRQNPNLHPNQNLGSRFRVLAALDLNMDTDNHGLEGTAEKDSTSHLETNSTLVVPEQAEDWEAGTSYNGNGNLGGKESFPIEWQRESREAGHPIEAQVLSRSTAVVDNTTLGYLNPHRPNSSLNSRESMWPVQFDGPRPSGLARESRGTRPPPTGLDDFPGGYIHPSMGQGGEVRQSAQQTFES